MLRLVARVETSALLQPVLLLPPLSMKHSAPVRESPQTPLCLLEESLRPQGCQLLRRLSDPLTSVPMATAGTSEPDHWPGLRLPSPLSNPLSNTLQGELSKHNFIPITPCLEIFQELQITYTVKSLRHAEDSSWCNPCPPA